MKHARTRALARTVGVSFVGLSSMAVDCDAGSSTDKIETGSDTGATVQTTTPSDCTGEFWNFPALQYTEVISVCVTGSSAVGVPPDFELTVPSSFGAYLAYPTWTDYDAGSDVFQLEINHGTPGSPLLNDSPDDGELWPWEHGPVCTDYEVTDVNFYLLDGYSYGWAYFAPTCPVSYAPMPQPLAPDGKVASGTQACTEGEGDFSFGVRRVLANSGTEATLWLTPVLEDGSGFPERAWLREIEVIDWGDATNLHLAGNVDPLEYAALAFIGGTDIPKPVSGPTVVSYAAGVKPMSVLFGTESIPATGTTFDLPKVHLTWSCPSGGSTHWTAVPGRAGHAGTIPSTYGVDHRAVFWIANDASTVRIAPEGRYGDYVESKLVTAGAGGKTFKVYLHAYDALFTGRLVKSGSVVQLKDAVITAGGTPTALSDQTLTAL